MENQKADDDKSVNSDQLSDEKIPTEASAKQETIITPQERTKNFSFATAYAVSRFHTVSNYKYNNSFAILKNSEPSFFIGKPNAIVHPVQRSEPAYSLKRDSKTNDYISSSNTEAPPSLRYYGRNTGELNRKKLFSPSRLSTSQNVYNRPLFITTVPTGVFLPPPKEPPLPAFLTQHAYAYSTQPVVLSPLSPKTYGGNNFSSSSSLQKNISRFSHNISDDIFKDEFQQKTRLFKRDIPQEPFKNVMHDRRVVRGSNFAHQKLVMINTPLDRAAELKRRAALRKKNVGRNQRNVLGTPPPIKGRQHEVIQTEKYLEELSDRLPHCSMETQTDLYLEKPPEPVFVPAKIGVDVGTEIGDGELFNFDYEAQPIIDVLVDSTIEQSMLEIAHEQEIADLRKKQREYLATREAELARLRELEAEDNRLRAEKERRLLQDAFAKGLDEQMQKSVTAAKLLQGHIAGLVPEVLENIEPITDATKKEELNKTICPWLAGEVAQEVGQIVDSREILTVIIQEIIRQRAEIYVDYKTEQKDSTPMVQYEGAEEEEKGLSESTEFCICDDESSKECNLLQPDKP